jgi:DNA-binding NarL/FixJ family response regulator
MSPKILIADDHAIVRHGVGFIIKETLPDAEIFLANNFDTLLQTLAETQLTLAICDVNMPGSNSFHMVQIIKKIQPELKIIIYSAFNESIYAPLFIKAGADAFLNKETENEDLIDIMLCLLNKNETSTNNKSVKNKSGIGSNGILNPITLLSERELEVANLLIKGFGTMQICYALDLNKNTISTYKKRIYEKMGISTIPELITIYRNYSDTII